MTQSKDRFARRAFLSHSLTGIALSSAVPFRYSLAGYEASVQAGSVTKSPNERIQLGVDPDLVWLDFGGTMERPVRFLEVDLGKKRLVRL